MAERKSGGAARGAASPSSIVRYFETLPDPRHSRNRRHWLGDIITIAVYGVSVGCSGPTLIAQWAQAKEDWRRPWLELPNGIPSRDCIRRVLSTLKPEAFQGCFQSWIARLMRESEEGRPVIAIDGKTARRSHDGKHGLGPLHLVSAWATEHGLSLGQVATDAKSNEITAIPELLERIDVPGALVTIDAMGCQKPIAEKVLAAQGDYVLAVKDNQPKLHAAIQDLFSDEKQSTLVNLPHHRHETCDESHGRRDQRYDVLAKLPEDFPVKDPWPGVTAVGMAVRVTQPGDGPTRGDVRYFISSRFLSGQRFAEAVRGHGGIKNSLHWVLDVSFGEDQSRARQRRIADNLSWLRRFAISLLKQHPSKHGIIGKSRMAGWSNDFLTEVLAAKGV